MAKKRVQRVVIRSKKRIQKKRRMRHFMVIASIIVFAEALMLGGYLYLPKAFEKYGVLRIRDVCISGVEVSDNLARLETYLEKWKQASVFSFDSRKAKNDLLVNFPEYKVKKCRYALPGRIVVDLEHRRSLAYISAEKGAISVDEEGVLFSSAKTDGMPEIIFFDRKSKDNLIKFLTLWRREEFMLPLPIKKAVAGKLGEVDLFLDDGTKIAWGVMDFNIERMTDKYNRLEIVIEKALQKYGKLKYINMRYVEDGRVLVRPDTTVDRS